MNRIFLLILVLGVSVTAGAKAQKTITDCERTKKIEQILSRIQLPQIPDNEFNIKNYGAVNNGLTDCKPAIDQAIKNAVEKGGGKVVVPAGKWFCKGPIHLESYINLHLDEGCTIVFSDDDKDYLPLQFVRWEGVEIYNYSPYIYAINKTNIAITGKGNFDGNAEEFKKWRQNQKPAQNMLRQMGQQGVPVNERVFGEKHYLRFAFIQFVSCENILLSDISISNVPFWVIQPTYCKSVTIKDVTVNSPNINNDGIDFDSTEDALVENCIFNCGDDAIVIKSGRDQDAWRVNKPSRNIVIRNCQAPEVLHGLAFGSEMSGGVEHVYVENFYIGKAEQYAIQFKANRDRGGYIRDVFIDGVFIAEAKTAVFFTNDYHGYSGGNFPSEFYNIILKNITCNKTTGKGIDIQGLAQKPIHHITLENVTVFSEEDSSTVMNTSNCVFENVRVQKNNFTNPEKE